MNLYRMYKWGINYHLPLFYPDAGFANIIYFLRIRANFFYDETHGQRFLYQQKFLLKRSFARWEQKSILIPNGGTRQMYRLESGTVIFRRRTYLGQQAETAGK